MNAACRNFISRDVQPRAADASDIVDGSCDATGRYYTRGSLSQAFRRETKTEPGLFVLLYTIEKAKYSDGQSNIVEGGVVSRIRGVIAGAFVGWFWPVQF